ncbi:MAG: hypothetical protein DCC58_09845 [Chloroflexi bacterium]|nr:MAG: hypothetical protein DCC58_09845 [Chloroflexota bacterium]
MSRAGNLQPSRVVGREREQTILSAHLAVALTGRGALVLLSGEAGIGKSALVRELAAAAEASGCRYLTGACYDGGATPYGPWIELSASVAGAGLPDWDPALLSHAASSDQVMTALRTFLLHLTEQAPLLLVLEDIHWADPESLQFLRIFARSLERLPIVLVATYRDDEPRGGGTLGHLVPHLVREAPAHRISLAPLTSDAVQALVVRYYDLPEADLTRLVSYVAGRSQGLPLYVLELLRALEEEQRLYQTASGWMLTDLERTIVPPLVRQVIDSRLARLGPDARRLLELAAVIGQDVPLLLWRRIAALPSEQFDDIVERAMDAHVLEEALPNLTLRFSHALVRDALYAGMSLPQRQRLHRRVAEALAMDADTDPEPVAHHFRQALDPRAVEWFMRAGSRVEQVAWLTAASHFGMALDMMGGGTVDSAQRGWLIIRRARLLRVAEPRTALAMLETALALAEDAADAVLHAYIIFLRGQTRSLAGEIPAGITDLQTSVAALARLPPADTARVDAFELQGVFPSRAEIEGQLAAVLAAVGRIHEALARSQAIIEREDDLPGRAWWARAIALALAGRVNEARDAYATARDVALRVSDLSSVVIMYLYQLSNIEVPYGADNLVERSRIAGEGEAVWRRLGPAHGDVSPRIARLPILLIEGDWAAARELALSGIRQGDASSERDLISATVLAQLALAQGDVADAWGIVHAHLPSGPQSIPGHMDFSHSLSLIRVAVRSCLEQGDLPAARAWLEAHDRWLDWSGAVLGQADGQSAWASYYLAIGDIAQARRHATLALKLASEPRQPLALLEAQRQLGRIETQAGRISDARLHLEAALALASACAAPYERALTLLSLAETELRAGSVDAASPLLEEARAAVLALGAAPASARADALAARLDDQASITARIAPAGLSPREVEVLQLIANGRNNREIAEALFLSVRTVERHITNLYAKIGAEGRADAIAFARRHALV